VDDPSPQPPERASAEAPPDFLRKDAAEGPLDTRVELFLESHHLIGNLVDSGNLIDSGKPRPDGRQPRRRLVDMLGKNGPSLVLRDASVESLIDLGEESRSYPLLHVQRSDVLIAVPVTGTPRSQGELEQVEKRPAAATLTLPGLMVTGHVYLARGADPASVPLIGKTDFLPVTHAEVTQVAAGLYRWQQPLVIVNLERLVLYAPAPAA
jgi:hypothetical protein